MKNFNVFIFPKKKQKQKQKFVRMSQNLCMDKAGKIGIVVGFMLTGPKIMFHVVIFSLLRLLWIVQDFLFH
jgi:hypothetical protein